MDTYGEFGLQFVDWVANRSGAILVLLASLPLALLLKEGRMLSYSALVVFVGAVAVILFSFEGPAGAVLVVLANTFLVLVALLFTRRRLTQIEDRLASVISAVGDLETAEERRQTFNAKRPSNSRPFLRRKPAAATKEQIVSAGAAESLGRERELLSGASLQELRSPDLLPGSAVPVSARPAGRNSTFRGPSKKAVLELNHPAGDGSIQSSRPQRPS
ncbi:hypothetical protein AJ88_15205 [Mesorhizobium amorphae CCBAU 01583]|nr:hypothetical protein AJ88_15205 [Mesorhizobium amorphae CCBAU 01583]